MRGAFRAVIFRIGCSFFGYADHRFGDLSDPGAKTDYAADNDRLSAFQLASRYEDRLAGRV